jgi:hypothetical protein
VGDGLDAAHRSGGSLSIRHCEERSDEAISASRGGLLRHSASRTRVNVLMARNDDPHEAATIAVPVRGQSSILRSNPA